MVLMGGDFLCNGEPFYSMEMNSPKMPVYIIGNISFEQKYFFLCGIRHTSNRVKVNVYSCC